MSVTGYGSSGLCTHSRRRSIQFGNIIFRPEERYAIFVPTDAKTGNVLTNHWTRLKSSIDGARCEWGTSPTFGAIAPGLVMVWLITLAVLSPEPPQENWHRRCLTEDMRVDGLRHQRASYYVVVAALVAGFVFMTPLTCGLEVGTDITDKIFSVFPGWR